VLQGGGLLPLAEAVTRARLAQRVAAQNIGFAFLYNIVAVPVAIAGFATPLIAALVMASSSLAVISNALRLERLPDSRKPLDHRHPEQILAMAQTSHGRSALAPGRSA
jgi:cation transport ATPase